MDGELIASQCRICFVVTSLHWFQFGCQAPPEPPALALGSPAQDGCAPGSRGAVLFARQPLRQGCWPPAPAGPERLHQLTTSPSARSLQAWEGEAAPAGREPCVQQAMGAWAGSGLPCSWGSPPPTCESPAPALLPGKGGGSRMEPAALILGLSSREPGPGGSGLSFPPSLAPPPLQFCLEPTILQNLGQVLLWLPKCYRRDPGRRGE